MNKVKTKPNMQTYYSTQYDAINTRVTWYYSYDLQYTCVCPAADLHLDRNLENPLSCGEEKSDQLLCKQSGCTDCGGVLCYC